MYTAADLAIKYLRYYLSASNGRGHGIHSPFVYEFTREVLMDKKHYPAYDAASAYYKKIKNDHRILEVNDLGAGSASGKTRSRKVSEIARTSVKRERYYKLLYRIGQYYRAKNIIELGTSLGVTSTCLSGIPGVENFITMEGAEEIAGYAEQHFKDAGLVNTKLVKGNFDQTLESVLSEIGRIDLAFVDGNHRKQPTLNYFQQIIEYVQDNSCIIFDDIHWSREMEEAWEEIKKDKRVRLSIDLFFVGIVFFSPTFIEKQDFTIRY